MCPSNTDVVISVLDFGWQELALCLLRLFEMEGVASKCANARGHYSIRATLYPPNIPGIMIPFDPDGLVTW
jgi:hypothetical protein